MTMNKESNQQETFRIELEREIEEVNEQRFELEWEIVDKVQELIGKKYTITWKTKEIEDFDEEGEETGGGRERREGGEARGEERG